jgi:hypothetical protein
MPEFTTVSVQEAELRTVSGRQGKYLSEYADYLLQLPHGQAGKLTLDESEKHPTIRRRLIVAAKALGIHIISKRSGNVLYFWREDWTDEQPRTKRRYTRRGAPGSLILPNTLINEPELGEQGIAPEEPLELGQLAQEAERRVEQA